MELSIDSRRFDLVVVGSHQDRMDGRLNKYVATGGTGGSLERESCWYIRTVFYVLAL
jgi:hypothetical protein